MENLNPNQENTALPAQSSRAKIATAVVFAVIAVIFWLMNVWSPYQGDDYAFNFVSEADRSSHRVEGVGDLLSSWKYHYMHGNGRFADDGCVRPTHFLGKDIFNFLTTGVFLAFLALLSKLGSSERKITASALVLAFAFWFFLSPTPETAVFWQTGACNYLWATTVALFWLFLFERARKREPECPASKIRLAVLFFVSVICGWFHEGISPVISLCVGIYGVFNFKKLRKEEIALALGFFAGTALVVLSPGIIARATSGSSMSVPPLTIQNLIRGVLLTGFWAKISMICLATLAFLAIAKRSFFKKFVRAELFYVAILCVAVAYNIFLRGAGTDRNCLFPDTIATLLFLKMFSVWNFQCGKKFIVAASGIASVCGLAVVLPMMRENSLVHQKFEDAAKNSSGLFIPADLPDGGKRVRFIDQQCSPDANFGDIHNLAISRYFGRKDRVFIAPKSFFDDIYEKDNFCVPKNEICPDWYSRGDLAFAIKKLRDGEQPVPADRIKYFYQPNPSWFLAEKVARGYCGDKTYFVRDFHDLSIPRVLEMPSGRYLAIPCSQKITRMLFLLPCDLVKIEITPEKN